MMEVLSDRYGWTPNQIRDISANDIDQYLQIISVRSELEKEQMKNGRK